MSLSYECLVEGDIFVQLSLLLSLLLLLLLLVLLLL